MCQFFSLISDGKGNAKYFDAEQRKQIKSGKLTGRHRHRLSPDSHSSIAEHYDMGKYNAYEYDPFTKVFHIDNLNSLLSRDAAKMKTFCKNLDFDTIVPGFNCKVKLPKCPKRKRASRFDLLLLKDYALYYNKFSTPQLVKLIRKNMDKLVYVDTDFASALIKSLLFPKRQAIAVKAARALYERGLTVRGPWGYIGNRWCRIWRLKDRTGLTVIKEISTPELKAIK